GGLDAIWRPVLSSHRPARNVASDENHSGLIGSPLRTMPPTSMRQLRPGRLSSVVQTGRPRSFSRYLQGKFSRPPTSTASPTLKRLPTRWLSGTPRVVRLRRWSAGRKLHLLAGSRRITARNRLEHFHLDKRDFACIRFDRVRAGAAEISIAFDPSAGDKRREFKLLHRKRCSCGNMDVEQAARPADRISLRRRLARGDQRSA